MLRSLLSNHLMGTGYVTRFGKLRRQRCQVVSTLDSQSGGSRLESRPACSLAGFVFGCPKFKSLATLVNSGLVPSCQLGF